MYVFLLLPEVAERGVETQLSRLQTPLHFTNVRVIYIIGDCLLFSSECIRSHMPNDAFFHHQFKDLRSCLIIAMSTLTSLSAVTPVENATETPITSDRSNGSIRDRPKSQHLFRLKFGFSFLS